VVQTATAEKAKVKAEAETKKGCGRNR